MRLNVCVNEMALFWPRAAVVKSKTFFDSDGSKEVCTRDEIVDPPGTTVLPNDRHGFAEGFVSFRTLCGVQSSLVRFTPSLVVVWGPPYWQAP